MNDVGPDFKFKTYTDNHPILLRKSSEISNYALKEHGEFLNNMFLYMRDCGGIGLAAPQIGLPYRFFIMHAPGDAPRVCINPVIKSSIDEQISLKEGCLSYPGLQLTLRRSAAVQVSYIDMSGNINDDFLQGWPARVFQHEYDHLEGVVFTEYASVTKLKLAKSKVKKNIKKSKRR